MIDGDVVRLRAILVDIHRVAGRGDGHATPEQTRDCIINAITMARIDRDAAEREAAQAEAACTKLEAAIQHHREQTGHGMCWENDEALWAALGEDVTVDHTPPPWKEFMERCAAYRASKDRA